MNKINITNSKKPNGTFANLRYVGVIVLILSLLLTFPFTSLRAQTEGEQNSVAEITVIELNNHYSTRLKQISESEYSSQKKESDYEPHKPYKVIRDVTEARKLLGKSVKQIGAAYDEEQDYSSYHVAVEITFKDRVKKRFDWRSFDENGFIAYYPELKVLILNHEADGDHPIDLNDSANENVGNPYYHSFSPDKQLRINGYYPGGAVDGVLYFLEKWNPQKKKYEFIGYLDGGSGYELSFLYASDWFWSNNSKVLFKTPSWGEGSGCYEMEIVGK